jgi:hypothetical protein
MYPTTGAPLASHTDRSAPPRPGRSSRTARTAGASSAASPRATSQVPSVLPLSAIVTTTVNGNPSPSKATSRRTLAARSRSSFRTGITIST